MQMEGCTKSICDMIACCQSLLAGTVLCRHIISKDDACLDCIMKDWHPTQCLAHRAQLSTHWLQRGSADALHCAQDEGFKEMQELVSFYKENAAILRTTFKDLGFSVYGGEDAPYVWVGFPGKPSWDVFAEILERCNIVTTPGSGFGPAGEGFVRASAFGHR